MLHRLNFLLRSYEQAHLLKVHLCPVTAVNDIPLIASLADLTILEDAAEQTVSLAGIGSGAANESQTLTLTITSRTINNTIFIY